MNDSVWAFPRPDHSPRFFQITTSFGTGLGGGAPQALARSAAATGTTTARPAPHRRPGSHSTRQALYEERLGVPCNACARGGWRYLLPSLFLLRSDPHGEVVLLMEDKTMTEDTPRNVSRRNFIKGVVASGAVVSTGGLFVALVGATRPATFGARQR